MSESDKKNALIPFTPTTLTRLNRELKLVDKLLEKIWTVKQKGIIEFYVEHSDFFCKTSGNLCENLQNSVENFWKIFQLFFFLKDN